MAAETINNLMANLTVPTWHCKRPRKEQLSIAATAPTLKAQSGPLDKLKVKPTSTLSETKKQPKTIMIGNTKIFDIGGGAKSVMDLICDGPLLSRPKQICVQ
ncbi:peptidoglycan-associated lipoprotein Pal [Sesbania bispinosa]|nr:peptidoglycan-associated lipoprotein Pal [Sesbania bispinosa]